jgi:hypothetical protein
MQSHGICYNYIEVSEELSAFISGLGEPDSCISTTIRELILS